MTMFNEWLMSTRVLQRQSFGTDPAALAGKELAEYIRWNELAAVDELMEALHEVDWKPWTVTDDGFRNRDAFVGELVDVLHFVANMLAAAKCTDEELSKRYEAKQQKNRERMASKSYDGKNKCPACQRAYDDESTKCYRTDNGWTCAIVGTGTASGSSITQTTWPPTTWNTTNTSSGSFTYFPTFPPPADFKDDNDDDEGESGVLV